MVKILILNTIIIFSFISVDTKPCLRNIFYFRYKTEKPLGY